MVRREVFKTGGLGEGVGCLMENYHQEANDLVGDVNADDSHPYHGTVKAVYLK